MMMTMVMLRRLPCGWPRRARKLRTSRTARWKGHPGPRPARTREYPDNPDYPDYPDYPEYIHLTFATVVRPYFIVLHLFTHSILLLMTPEPLRCQHESNKSNESSKQKSRIAQSKKCLEITRRLDNNPRCLHCTPRQDISLNHQQFALTSTVHHA